MSQYYARINLLANVLRGNIRSWRLNDIFGSQAQREGDRMTFNFYYHRKSIQLFGHIIIAFNAWVHKEIRVHSWDLKNLL